ncbi:MAG: hypothetical protein AAF456_02280 [Planctomycetota bacterium]
MQNKDVGFVLLEAAGTTAQNLLTQTYTMPPFGIGVSADGENIPYTIDLDPRSTEPDTFLNTVIETVRSRTAEDKLKAAAFAYAGSVTRSESTGPENAICVQIEFDNGEMFVAYRVFTYESQTFNFEPECFSLPDEAAPGRIFIDPA